MILLGLAARKNPAAHQRVLDWLDGVSIRERDRPRSGFVNPALPPFILLSYFPSLIASTGSSATDIGRLFAGKTVHIASDRTAGATDDRDLLAPIEPISLPTSPPTRYSPQRGKATTIVVAVLSGSAIQEYDGPQWRGHRSDVP